MSDTAVSEAPVRRIDLLSRSKPIAPGFLPDRRSVYWIDNAPPRPAPDGITIISASSRVQDLARARNLHSNYIGDRSTPIWPVSRSAQTAEPTQRLEQLGKAKRLNPLYLTERSPYMIVSHNAMNASLTPRLDQLAHPKERRDNFCVEETEWGEYQPVLPSALSAQASARIESLAEVKRFHPMYHGSRSVQWPVTEAARKAIAGLRLQQLSRPRSRTMIKDDYDPYKVTYAARHARPTGRLDELSVPIERKVRKKKGL